MRKGLTLVQSGQYLW